MIFKQIDEIRNAAMGLPRGKTETRRLAKPDEQPITDPETGLIIGILKNGKQKNMVGRMYAVKPSMYAPALSDLRYQLVAAWQEPVWELSAGGATREGIWQDVNHENSWWTTSHLLKLYQEGIAPYSHYPSAIEGYIGLWSVINGAKSWQQNPVVWVYRFRPFVVNVTPVQLALVEPAAAP